MDRDDLIETNAASLSLVTENVVKAFFQAIIIVVFQSTWMLNDLSSSSYSGI